MVGGERERGLEGYGSGGWGDRERERAGGVG